MFSPIVDNTNTSDPPTSPVQDDLMLSNSAQTQDLSNFFLYVCPDLGIDIPIDTSRRFIPSPINIADVVYLEKENLSVFYRERWKERFYEHVNKQFIAYAKEQGLGDDFVLDLTFSIDRGFILKNFYQRCDLLHWDTGLRYNDDTFLGDIIQLINCNTESVLRVRLRIKNPIRYSIRRFFGFEHE